MSLFVHETKTGELLYAMRHEWVNDSVTGIVGDSSASVYVVLEDCSKLEGGTRGRRGFGGGEICHDTPVLSTS